MEKAGAESWQCIRSGHQSFRNVKQQQQTHAGPTSPLFFIIIIYLFIYFSKGHLGVPQYIRFAPEM